MNRGKNISILAYAAVFFLLFAAIFYYGRKEGERAVLEQDLQMESRNRTSAVTKEQEAVTDSNAGNERQETMENTDQIENIQKQTPFPASSVKEIKVEQDTVYRMEIYDIYTQKMTVQEGTVPPGFLGMTREELSEYWTEYVREMSITEFEKGLLSCELTLFSQEQITIRKTYDGSGLKYRYYMVLEQGCVSVYYSDKKTPYEHTDIFAEDLADEERTKLENGIYVEDEEELYSILESYTS